MAKEKYSILRRILLAFSGVLITTVLFGLVVLLFGRVQGEEFAPTHFQSRTFSYYQVPLLEWQLTPIRRRSTTGPVSRYVRSQNHVTSPTGAPKTWDVVRINALPGDAEILKSILAMRHQGGPFWEEWSADHPERAAVLWPIVQKLATAQLYVMLPEVFETARRSESAGQLAAALDAYLVTAYADLAEDLLAAGRPEQARLAVEDGRAAYPDDPRLMRLATEIND